MTCILVHLPTDDLPPLRDYVRYLPAGLRIFAAYLMAHKLYLEGKYERALGILDAIVISINKPYPIPEIYMNCMISICRIKNKNLEGAKEAFLTAWGMAKPDGLLEAFIEHHGLLQGIVESCLKKEEPEAYKALTKGVLRFSRGWMKLHNKESERNITDALTPQEFAIAMLAVGTGATGGRRLYGPFGQHCETHHFRYSCYPACEQQKRTAPVCK